MPKKTKSRTISVKMFYDSFDTSNPGLRSYFHLVEKGQPEVYATPWIMKGQDNLSNEEKLKRFFKIMNEWLPHLEPLSKEWPSLYDFEKDQSAKVGPMSVMKPLDERLPDIDAYYDGILLPAVPISDDAIKAAIGKFQRTKGTIHARSEQKTVDLMKKSTNSGSPFFTKRRNVVKDTVPCTVSNESQILSGHEWGSAAVLGWRGQEGGPSVADTKQRVVWMFPFAVNIQELRVYQPLIESFQKFNSVPAWVSMESVDQEVTLLFDTKGKDDLVICTDFTKFDQHFNPVMQDGAKKILSAMMSKSSDSSNWLNKVYPIKYAIPLAFDFGKVRTGLHGMGSGSGGTNADETLAHTALQYEAALEAGKQLNPHSQCLGDDGILSFPGATAEMVMRSYAKHGLEMNLEKQEESKHECVYLRRWHHEDYRKDGICVGVYSTCRALGRLCMQERYYDDDVWSSKMVALRELSIIENCKHHPLREEFAEFCMKQDKFRLGLDIPGFLDNVGQIAKEATELMPDFLGYTKSLNKDAETGIESWWIVRYLKSKK